VMADAADRRRAACPARGGASVVSPRSRGCPGGPGRTTGTSRARRSGR
jgi:hypothetical protein